MTNRKMDFSRSTALLNIERILETLRKNDLLTIPEIAERVFLCEPQVRIYMAHLKAQGKVHHPSWTREPVAGLRAFPRARFRVGPGVNRARPPRLTSAQAQARVRQRVKQDPDSYPHVLQSVERQRIDRAMRSRRERVALLREQGYPPELVYAAGSALRAGLRRRSPTPDQVATIIRLRDEGKTWDEVSQGSGVPRSTARTYYMRIVGGCD